MVLIKQPQTPIKLNMYCLTLFLLFILDLNVPAQERGLDTGLIVVLYSGSFGL